MSIRIRRRVAPLALLPLGAAFVVVSVAAPGDAAAPYPTPVMTGYVPLEANATRQTMLNANSGAGTTLDFTVGITNAGAGAVLFYDHWEDGYEADITNPVQSTTQVWGDADTVSGNAQTYCGVRCAGDLLPAGAVFVLRNNIAIPRNASSVLWDGRDRISSTRGFTITAGGFSTPLGSVLSASASAYDTTKWGTDYWIPIGENMTPPANTTDAFSTTSVQIMADRPGTVVTVDSNGDGTTDATQTLGAGQVMFVNGGVNRGAHVQATAPVQVHVGSGEAGAAYELRWFTLFPTASLTADYLNPVGTTSDNQRTITYLFNPNPAAITVTPGCPGCSGSLNVPAGGGASFASPVGQAVRFVNAGGQPFVAVGASGSESGALPGSAGDNSATYDWGFGLVPTRLLTSKAVLGWAPGNSGNPPSTPSGNRDDDPVWISAMQNTTLYVDFDGDPTTGSLGPQCDGQYDSTISVTAGLSYKIHDAADGDMTGASIYTCDGTLIAGAWGEDASNAPTGAPGFDAGYALIPSTAMVVNKTSSLAVDSNGDGRFGPGDRVQYDISIADAGALSFTDLQIADSLPAGTAYLPGSTTFDDGDGVDDPFADDATPPAATAYPFDEAGAAIPTIDPGDTVHIKYVVQIVDPFPAGTSIVNVVDVGADQTDGGDADVIDLVAADLSLAKVVSTPATYLGQQATFTVTLTNDGPDAADDVRVTDAVPAGTTFVSAAPSVGTYDSNTGVWSVGSVPGGATRTLAMTVTVNALTVTNDAEVTHSLAADPDSTPANGSTTEDDDASASLTVLPRADVSLDKTLVSGPDSSGNSTFRLTLSNSGPSTSTGVQVSEYPPAGSSFVSAAPQNNATADGTFDGGTNVWTVPDLAAGTQAQMLVTYQTPVAPGTNYAQVTAATTADPDSNPDTTPLSGTDLPDQDDEDSTGVPASGDVSVTNLVTGAPTFVGDTAELTVTVTNDGPTNTSGVNVRDLLPSTLTFVSAVPSTGTYDPSTGVWSVGGLAPGESQTLVLAVRVMAPGTIDTTAELTSSSAPDVDSTPNNADPVEDDQQTASISTTGASLGDRVWFDIDNDFGLDAGEPGLAGVAVTASWAGPNTILGDGDDVDYTANTAADGTWSLSGLPHGNYTVSVDPSTLPAGITTAVRDRDGSGSAHTSQFALAGGSSLDDVDFAYTGSATIGDAIFTDTNGDAAPSLGEGIAGATVTLTWRGFDGVASGDDLAFSVITDGTGDYQFVNLPAGVHVVDVDTSTLPVGLRHVVDPDGGNDDTASVTLTVGESRLEVDFGYDGTNSIGDTVFADIDGDGAQGAGEAGLGGVTVTLLLDADSNGSYEATIGSTITSGAGTYLFDDLPAGRYRVTVGVPSGLTTTTPTDIDVVVADGDTVTTADFGLRPPPPSGNGAIGDRVWDDVDGDGVQDAGEPGLTGVGVVLRRDVDGDGTFETNVADQSTDSAGAYGFANLPAGRYSISVDPPAGRFPTTPTTYVVDVVAGTAFDTGDFGLASSAVATASIGDRVWSDTDADGVDDGGEPGLPGVALTLRRDDDGDGTYETTVATTTSQPDGSYQFANLAPGAYRVVAGVPSGQFASTPSTISLTLTVGAVIDTADFGIAGIAPATGTIGDRVWLDTDGNGAQDVGEPGVNGVAVTLHADLDGDGTFETVVATTNTAGDGNYQFTNVAPGSFVVTVTPPTGLVVATPAPAVQVTPGSSITIADVALAIGAAAPYDLTIAKSAGGTAIAGGNVTWTIVVTNLGTSPSPTDVAVADVLPAGLTFVSADGTGWSCGAAAQVVTCTHAAAIAGGGSASIAVITGVTASAGSTIVNSASVAAAGVELNSANNDDSAQLSVAAAPTTTTATTTTTTTTVPSTAATTTVRPTSTTAVGRSGSLASTGSDTQSPVRIALVLIAAGLALTVVATATRRKGV